MPQDSRTPLGTRVADSLITWVALLCPFLAISYYVNSAHDDGFRTAVYGLAVALGASATQRRLVRRLLPCVVIALWAAFLQITFDIVMIVGVVSTAAVLAVGALPRFLGAWWKHIVYRVLRLALATAALLIAMLLPLQYSGNDPAAGGDITEVGLTFGVITYLPIVAVVLLDWAVGRLEHRTKRSARFPRCAKCGYNLTGNTSGRCPECGEPAEKSDAGNPTDHSHDA